MPSDDPKKPLFRKLLNWLNLIVLIIVMFALLEPGGPVGQKIVRWMAESSRIDRIQESWERVEESAVKFSGDGDGFQLVEVVDYECPFCRRSHATLLEFAQERPEIDIGIIHFPLSDRHPFAERGAKLAICAEQQDQFRSAHDYLFATAEWQEAGLKQIGEEVGVSNIEAFVACFDSPVTDDLLMVHLDLVQQLEIPATPTLITQESMHPGEFSLEDLRSMLQD